MKLSTRFTVSLVAMVAITGALIGLVADYFIQATMHPIALQNLEFNVSRYADRLETEVRSISHDVAAARENPAVVAFAQSNFIPNVPEGDSSFKDQVAAFFLAEVGAKPTYLDYPAQGVARENVAASAA